nr:hypothetical protein [Gemmatimonadota bacterium]
ERSVPERLLSLAFAGLVAGGLVLAAAPDWIGLAWLNRGVDRAFFQTADPTAGAIELRRWLYGVEGSTLVAFGILGFAVVRTAVRQGEPWAWKALALAVGTWFLLDTSISMAHGVWENAALNVVIALVVLIPTLALRIRRRPPAPS